MKIVRLGNLWYVVMKSDGDMVAGPYTSEREAAQNYPNWLAGRE